MNVRRYAVWLLVLGALAASEIRSRTLQLPAEPAQLSSSDEVTLRVIVADSAEKAQRIVTRLQAGENFITLAQSESIDPTASTGGLLGRLALSTLPPVLRDALVGVAPGQLSLVVQIPTGFAILKVVDDADPASRSMNAATSTTLATEANVKYVIDVSGLLEAEAVLQAFPKPDDWNQDPLTICQMRRKSLGSSQSSLESFLSPERESARRSRSPFDLMQAQFALAQLHAYDGRMDRALVEYQHAYETARSGVAAAILRMEEALGVAHLHMAGTDNDTHRAPGDLCLFPLRPGRSYAKTGDAKRAIEHFQRFLKQKPDDLEVRWLLNLAYMAMGRYPDAVPPAYLIAPASFSSPEDVGRFRDVAPHAGLAVVATAGGLIVDDFAGTGRFDVVTSNFDDALLPQQRRRHLHGTYVTGRARWSAGRAEHDADRLQQRRLQGHPAAARRMGDRPAQVAPAEQLRRHLHRCHRRQRTGAAGDERANGSVGRYQQRRLAGSLRRQRGKCVTVVLEQRWNDVR